jgi:sigma-E factor negative regulatory protein RseB
VISSARASRGLTSVAVVIGLLGACAVLVVLVDSPLGSGAARRADTSDRRGGAHAASVPLALAHTAAPAQPATAANRLGVRLLTEAVTACQAEPFHGEQIAAWFGSAETVSVIQVWHRPDGDMLVQASKVASGAGPHSELSADPAGPDEVLTLTSPLLALMRKNYVISYGGPSDVDGRPAQMVEVRHPGGALAARFWVDTATKLPLRRELIDGGALLSEDAFLELSVGTRQLDGMPKADAHPWSGRLTARDRAHLKARGWPLPATSVAGLSLFQATQKSTKSGKVVELSYSDGLSVISVFVQRGELPHSLPGWRRFTSRGGSVVYASDPNGRDLAWSTDGYVYTMISDAPPGVVEQVVMHLPHNRSVGFWARMGRGFRRLASWANPFH